MTFHRVLMLLIVVLALNVSVRVQANETDQFTLPVGKEFVDLGHFFSERAYSTLTKVVGETNRQIRDAVAASDGRTLARLHSSEHIAREVYQEYGLGFAHSDRLERLFHARETKDRFPGRIVAYKPSRWIYSFAHLPFDPRGLFVIAKGSTIKVYGVYMGTDKIGHLHHLGYWYFKKAIDDDGATHEEQARRAVRSGSRGAISEGGIIGNIAAGVYSNGDLAANYVGMKFYFNLTQPTRLQGKTHPPMLVRQGDYWALNTHITADAPIFQPFVSEHYNEALNPCVYTPGLRGTIARRVRKNARNILAFYADDQGRPRPREYFEAKVAELWTYYGEDYGHSDGTKNLVTIAATCFDQPDAATRYAEGHRRAPQQAEVRVR